MKIYYQMKVVVPTKIQGGVRKIEVELMPDHMSFLDSVCNKDNNNIITNEQGYTAYYDENTAIEVFKTVLSDAISVDYIMFFEKTKSDSVKQIESNMF